MKVGIRLQLLLALSGLLALAFVPLFFAFASLTRATLRAMHDRTSAAVADTIARDLVQARKRLGPDDLRVFAEAETATGNTLGIGLYDAEGRAELRVTRHGDLSLPERLAPESGAATPFPGDGSSAWMFRSAADSGGTVAVVVRRELDLARAAPLLRLVGLYTALIALALLVFTYAAITKLIVRPIDAISSAARRVAGGARSFDIPGASGATELADLARSLGDMTGRLKADEQELREQIQELERRASQLREAQDRLIRSERLASVGRLAAGLAHELGNPLAALIGLEDLLLGGGLTPPEERDFLVRIRSETDRIHRVLRDLLDFARPASANSIAEPANAGSVVDAVNDVIALVKPQRAFRDLELKLEVPPDLPPVTLETGRIVQVLLNLLLNAADATGPGGHVGLSAELRPDGALRILVTDDGPGISPAVLPHLFEPFASTKEVGKGTGLGLAVSRGLVEAAGGTVQNLPRAADEKGAAFEVVLPLAP